jgi:hypothetical protein
MRDRIALVNSSRTFELHASSRLLTGSSYSRSRRCHGTGQHCAGVNLRLQMHRRRPSTSDRLFFCADVIYMLGHRLVKFGPSHCVKIKHMSDLCQRRLHTVVIAELPAG